MKKKMNYLIVKMRSLFIILAFLYLVSGCEESYIYLQTDNSLPDAEFSYTLDQLTVKFANKSSDATSYAWDFGDGQTSVEKNPEHSFAQKGKFTVVLKASDNNNVVDEYSLEIAVGYPLASFTYSADKLEVTYTNTSANANSYLWDFGDGFTSTEENPVHTFAESGTYSVSLTAIDGSDENTTSTDILVLGKTVPVILNPSFEESSRSMWAKAPETSTYTLSQSPIPPDGPNGAKLGNSAQYLYQVLNVDPNEEYTIRYYVASKLPADAGNLEIINHNTQAVIVTGNNAGTAANAYEERFVSFNTGSATQIAISVKWVATEIRFDMFTIE